MRSCLRDFASSACESRRCLHEKKPCLDEKFGMPDWSRALQLNAVEKAASEAMIRRNFP